MKTKFKSLVLIIVSCSLLLSSCQGNKQGSGAVIGAVGGGLLGSMFGKGAGQLVAVGLGAVAGGLIGSTVGKSLDEHDKMMAEKTANKALETAPSGSSVGWKNPDSGHSGSITPTKTFKQNDGRYCREYTQTVVVGGETKKAYGTACRQPDGQWEIVK